MLNDPELSVWMVDDDDGLAEGRGDIVVVPLKVDGMSAVDAAAAAQREVEIQERGGRHWTHSANGRERLLLPDLERPAAGGAVYGAVLAGDFHLEDGVGLLPGGGAGVGEKGDETSLEGSESALDLALGLRRRSHKMGDAETPEGALEFAHRIVEIVAGAWPEEAQAVGVNDLGETPFSEGFPEVFEMVPCRIGTHEATREVESRVIVGGEQKGLLGGGGPPLVDGAVVLPEFADVRTTEAPIDARFAHRRGHEVRIVGLDVCLYRGTGANQTTEAHEFVGDELIVGRVLQWQKIFQKRFGFWGPLSASITATGGRLEAIAPVQEVGSKLVEPGTAHPEMDGCSGGVECACVEVVEDATDVSEGLAVDELLFFIVGIMSLRDTGGQPCRDLFRRSVFPLPLRRPTLRFGLLRGSGKTLLPPPESNFVPSPVQF
jgi:hypothetical protein